MLVNHTQAALIVTAKDVSHSRVVEMLLVLSLAVGRDLGNLFSMQAQQVCRNRAITPEDLDVDVADFDLHLRATGKVLALPAQHHQTRRFCAFGCGTKDQSHIGIEALPFFSFFGRKKLPKRADSGFNLSLAE